ncbi:MAG: histidine phosphatase family protein [Mitsuaria chitosanitabida]|uniref:histidine phosphatase family protein n=1 Tax=Roseateles chitosanitabidus TaxID=65048 RepID=UPI001B21DB66|nr:histidine phosphatase family protein [Roseateles chitosanitabidus]MBO9686063.1 histidine phosphatase family protein [Roseateles chitosanitabidus]
MDPTRAHRTPRDLGNGPDGGDTRGTGAPIEVWRHPRPDGAAGRCVGGRCDLPVPPRRAKRLARRIQAHARKHRLAHEVWTSPLRRCADVGRWLKRWGWTHRIDAALAELDFGAWDGRPWAEIPKAAIDEWVRDFATFAPEGGESLTALLARASGWSGGGLVVSHGGWMLARRWVRDHPDQAPQAARWPSPPAYGERWSF